jgi:phytoene synthase
MTLHWEQRLRALAGEAPHPSTNSIISYWADDFSLQTAYKSCAALTAAHSKSFHLASAFLPEPKRQAVRALYAFCRTVDDIVDTSVASDRQARLDEWRRVSLEAAQADEGGVAAAWADTLRRYHIPRHYALQLIDGVARDLAEQRYDSFDDLATYCYGVASTVGLMSMYIVGFKTMQAIPYAIKLGVALQMTNILRDVGEDLRSGRLYLPLDELRAFNLTPEQLHAGEVTANWQAFMRFQIERARRLYEESAPGIPMLHPEGRLAISAASNLYSGILEAIERNNYDVFSQRASLSGFEKLSRIPALLLNANRFSYGTA